MLTRSSAHKLASAFIPAALSVLANESSANVIGNDTQNFNPTTSGIDFVTVQSTQTLDVGILNLGFFINSARNVLPDTENSAGAVVESRDLLTTGDLNFGYGLTRRIDLGLNISYLLDQSTDRTEPGAQFAKSGMNEIRANSKLRILDRKPIGLAFIASANFNQVKNNPFLGMNPGPTWNLEAAADTEVFGNIIAINLGYRFRNTGDPLNNSLFSPLPNQVISSVGISRYFPKLDLKAIAEVFAARATSSGPAKAESATSSELILGAKYDFNRSTSVQAGLGRELNDGLFTPDFRAYLGFNFALDVLPHRQASIEIEIPAPTPAPQIQAQIIEVKQGFQPEDIKKLADVPLDDISSQHEFILRTQLPKDPSQTKKPPFELVRLEGFEFEFGSSSILPQHRPTLDRLIAYLNSAPPVLKLRIEGHTDSVGSEEKNQRRSASRADAVRKYLQANGLQTTTSIESVGYGSSRPIADNGNFQGRQQNRRVEVRIVRTILTAPGARIPFEKSSRQ